MIINQHILLKGGVEKKVYPPDVPFLFRSNFSHQKPEKFNSWKVLPKLLVSKDNLYDFTGLVGGDFSIWCEDKNEYVQIKEGVYVKVGKYYVWFEPCEIVQDDRFRDVKGEFELNLDSCVDLIVKVKS